MNKKSLLQANTGFTLLEIVIVLAVMGIFLMVTIPAAGRLEQTRRILSTRDRMEAIRTAMLGHRAFDKEGRRQVNGYTGDLGTLPELNASAWNMAGELWDWPHPPADEQEFEYVFHMRRSVYYASGLGQPRGLWEHTPIFGQPSLGARWRGAYLPEPADEFPENEVGLIWDPFAITDTKRAETREYEMRQTAGKLADRWGRSLLFFYVDPPPPGSYAVSYGSRALAGRTTVYLVSEGPDMRSSPPAYDKEGDHNRDNIIMVITPLEWQDETRIKRTESYLGEIREALIGSREARDSYGRSLTGGYTGDLGDWPKAYTWEQDPVLDRWIWMESEFEESVEAPGTYFREGSLRGLWTDDPDGPATPERLSAPQDPVIGGEHEPQALGFGWRGPYLPEPPGQDAEQVLRDAWGTPIRFRRIYSSSQQAEQRLAESIIITSAGPDAIFDNIDDITATLPRSFFDVEKQMAINVTLVNETDMDLILGSDTGHIRIRLHTSPVLVDSFVWPPEGHATSTIPAGDRLNLDIPFVGAFAGTRLIEVAGIAETMPLERRRAFSYVDVTDKGFLSPGLKSNDRVVMTIR